MFYGFHQSARERLETKDCKVEEAVRVVEKECQGNNKSKIEVASKNLMKSLEDPCPHTRYQADITVPIQFL